MSYKEEVHARRLHADLSETLGLVARGATVLVSGEGVHWHCRAELGERRCFVYCFHVFERPEFLIRFEQARSHVWGRTDEQPVDAVCAWLQGQSVEVLYERFPFVERRRRALESIEREMLHLQPDLADGTHRELSSEHPDMSESCTLWFRACDRACSVAYYGYDDAPNALFFWDACRQFQIQTKESPVLARLLKRWLHDRVMPSVIEREFPITLEKVATYYEQGRGVEGEFIESWEGVERSYNDARHSFTGPVRDLVAQLRQGGYDRHLRAGTSLFSLILSRSRRHGLQTGQPHIILSFGGAPLQGGRPAAGTMEVTTRVDGEQTLIFEKIELTERLLSLIKQLLMKPID